MLPIGILEATIKILPRGPCLLDLGDWNFGAMVKVLELKFRHSTLTHLASFVVRWVSFRVFLMVLRF